MKKTLYLSEKKTFIFFLTLPFLLTSCSSLDLDTVQNKSVPMDIARLLENGKTTSEKTYKLSSKMSLETESSYKGSILKNLDLSEITDVKRKPFLHMIDYHFYKGEIQILGVALHERDYRASSKPQKDLKPYCGVVKDGTCNCYFWKGADSSFSGECLVHIKNEEMYHSYARAYFDNSSYENAKLAVRMIRSIESEVYSDENISGYVSYIGKRADPKISHSMDYVSKNGCLYTIKYKDFISSLKEAKIGQDYEINNYIGKVNFIELGEYWIDKNFTVMLMEDGKMWTLDQSDFEKGLKKVKTSSNKMKCKNVL